MSGRSAPPPAEGARSLSADSLMSVADSTDPFPPFAKSVASFGSLDSPLLLQPDVEEGSLRNYKVSGNSNFGYLGSAYLRDRAVSDTTEGSTQIATQTCNDLIDFSSDDENKPYCPTVTQPKDSDSNIATQPRSFHPSLVTLERNCHGSDVTEQRDCHPHLVTQPREYHRNIEPEPRALLTPAEMYKMQRSTNLKTRAQSLPRKMNVEGTRRRDNMECKERMTCEAFEPKNRLINTNVVCLLVIGGKGSDAREIQRKSLDLWKCDIDPGQYIVFQGRPFDMIMNIIIIMIIYDCLRLFFYGGEGG